jgi:hypothetical protein
VKGYADCKNLQARTIPGGLGRLLTKAFVGNAWQNLLARGSFHRFISFHFISFHFISFQVPEGGRET